MYSALRMEGVFSKMNQNGKHFIYFLACWLFMLWIQWTSHRPTMQGKLLCVRKNYIYPAFFCGDINLHVDACHIIVRHQNFIHSKIVIVFLVLRKNCWSISWIFVENTIQIHSSIQFHFSTARKEIVQTSMAVVKISLGASFPWISFPTVIQCYGSSFSILFKLILDSKSVKALVG